MRNMMDRAMHYMERDAQPGRVFTLTELRVAVDIRIRSQHRLATMLLDSGMVERHQGGLRIRPYLIAATFQNRDAELERQTVAAYVAEGLGEV